MIMKKAAASLLTVLALGVLTAAVLADPATPDNGAPATTPPAPPAAPAAPATPAPTDTTPPPPATPPGIRLRLKFKKGEEFVYRVTTTSTGMISVAGRTVPMDSSSSMVMTQTVVGVRPDGAARLAIGMHSMTVTAQGRTIPIGDKMKSMLAGESMVMDPSGNVSSMRLGNGNPVSGMLGGASGMSGMLGGYALPTTPEHIGDIWTSQTNLTAMGMSTTTNYTLLNTWLQNGKQFAAIHGEATGTMNMRPSAQLPMSMSGPVNTTTDLIMDATSGVIRQAKTSAHIQMSMTMNMPASQYSQGGQMNSTNDTTTTSVIQLVRVEQH